MNRIPLTILIATLLLSACTDDRRVLSLLDRAEALMEASPDSASRLLHAADSTIAQQSENTRMRHAVLLAEANNKLYQPLPSDTIFQEVVDYYDRHGTPNQQLLAHYLLGCIYRDRNEAPQALQCYYDAIEKADTLSPDCDYTTLYKVYGQMADIFEDQVMPDEEIEALKQYSKYALKAGNIFEYIHGFECQVFLYDQKRDTAMILSTEKQAYELYKKHGFPHAAASAHTTSVYVYLARGNNAKAHELMEMFEKESGLFDANGNICEGREHYYYSKGLYYTNIHQLDSAEFYFRKLLKYGYSFDAYNGLITISKQRGDAHSALLYMEHYEAAFDTLVTNIHAEATRQALGMYNYSRHQKIAAQKTTEAHQREKELHITFIILILVGAISYHLYAKIKARRKAEVQLLNQQLVHISALYRKTKEDLDIIDKDLSTYKDKKQKELNELQQQLVQLQEEYGVYKQK